MKDQRQEQIIEDFELFDEWLDKYSYIIELSADLPLISEQNKTPEHVIEGCQSRVWIAAKLDEQGGIEFTADSDAIITKGIIALLIKVMNGRTPQEVLQTDLYFIDAIGLSENLSPTRSNGLLAMIKQMKLFAMAFEAQKK
ncbi:MAG: SufE family protein [Rikenellaceae bacterium]